MSKIVKLHKVVWEDGVRRHDEIELTLIPFETFRDIWDVYQDGVKIGRLEKDPDHRFYQVHNRIRYDNKPRVAWKGSNEAGRGWWVETRIEALAMLMQFTFWSDLHMPGNPKKWAGKCELCH